MPLTGEYEPSPSDWARKQVELYEATNGKEGAELRGRPVIVLTSTRDASDYGGRIGSSPAAGFLPKDQLSGAALRRFLAASSPAGT